MSWSNILDSTRNSALTTNNRAVSATVSYMLSLMLLSLIVGSVSLLGGQYVDSFVSGAVAQEVDTVNQRTMHELQQADLNTRSQNTDLYSGYEKQVALPERVSDQQYRIFINKSQPRANHTWNSDHTGLTQVEYGTYTVTVVTGQNVRQTSTFTSMSKIQNASVSSGDVVFRRPAPTDENINQGICELYDTNGEPGLQSVSDAESMLSVEYPDTCEVRLEEQ